MCDIYDREEVTYQHALKYDAKTYCMIRYLGY